MTLVVNNDGVGISKLVTPANTGDETASLQIRDSLDFPHSGVFKALYSAATGNYALKNGAAGSMGFNFTYAGGTSPTVAVALGKIFRDGKYVAISALSAHALTRPTSGYFYHLVVVAANNTMDVRISSAVDDVPELTDGDIPIGLIKVAHDANTGTAGLPTQFFTSYKTDNNLSIGYVDSNAYTEAGSITGSANGLLYSSGLTTTGAVLTMATNEPSVVNNDVLGRINFQAPLESDGVGDSRLVGASIAAVAQDTFTDSVNSTSLVFQTGKSETATTKMSIDEDGLVNIAGLTASEIVIADANKNLVSAAVATYPSLTELAYVKGLTSAVQTQIGTKIDTAGTLLDKSSTTLNVDLNEAAAAVMAAGDGIIFVDSDDSNVAKQETLSDLLDTIAGTVGTTGLDRSGATLVVSDLHPVGVSGSANQLLTDDGDGTVTSESALTFDGKSMLVNTDTAGVGAEDMTGLHVDFDRTVAGSGTAAHNDIGINLDVNSASLGTSSVIGMDIDVVGATSGTHTATGLTVDVGSADTNYAALFNGGNVGIGTTAPSSPLHVLDSGTGDTFILESTAANAVTHAPNLILYRNGSDTPLVNELIGEIKFRGENNNTQDVEYATIQGGMDDITDGSEDGNLTFNLIMAGSSKEFMRLRASTQDVVINDQHEDIDFRVEGDTDSNLFFCDASADKIGISTGTPMNMLQVNVTGADGLDGIQIVRDDATTADGEILGGIGFDSIDGNVPSTITEASAFIASYATEDHTATDKGGNLKFGVSLIDEDDDVVSTILANVGPPDTTANATCHAGFNSRATTAIVAAATYAPTVTDSGTLVIFEHANSNLTLPSINDAVSVGVQFTVFNETGSAINAQIAVSDSATVNGDAIADQDDIASFKAATFVCSGNNTWIRIG